MKKALLYLVLVILIFAIFFYILLRPSKQSNAIKEVEVCMNKSEVKSVWDKYRSSLSDNEDFCQTVRDKLTSFGLKTSEVKDVKKWLPTRTSNLNIIVVPDLSKRIKDPNNNPDQIVNDTAILNSIWKSFEKAVRLKMNSKDRLVVEVSDPDQGQGQFKTVADNLVFDLSDHKNKSNRIYFNEIPTKFSDNIKTIYDIALKGTTGANYAYYFSQKLPTKIQKSDLYDDYRNIVIILTDGYLEITTPNRETESISPNGNLLKRYCSTGDLSTFRYPALTRDLDFSDVETYLFEVNERQEGKSCHFQALKKWWDEWFKLMHVKNAGEENIFRRQDAINLSKKDIQAIFERK